MFRKLSSFAVQALALWCARCGSSRLELVADVIRDMAKHDLLGYDEKRVGVAMRPHDVDFFRRADRGAAEFIARQAHAHQRVDAEKGAAAKAEL